MIKSNTNIMIVEDEWIVAEDIQRIVMNSGYKVTSIVNSGHEVLGNIKKNKPDLVLMDIRLSNDVNGIEAAQKIQTEFDIPIIYITAFVNDELLQRAKLTEPFGYLIKPFNERELLTTIELALYKFEMHNQLKTTEEFFRVFADFTLDWEYWFHPKVGFLYISPSCEQLTGYSPKEFGNDPDLLRKIIHPDDKKMWIGHKHNIKESGQIEPIEFRITTKTKNVIWVEHICQPITKENGEFLGIRGANRNINDRKILEDRVRHSQKLEAIGRLAGGVAHELNNLLMVILANSNLLATDFQKNDDKYETVKTIETYVIKAANLTKQLLAYTRKEKGQNIIIDIHHIIEKVKNFFKKSLTKKYIFKEEFHHGALKIKGDPDQLFSVFLNLVLNAQDAMPDGGTIFFKTEISIPPQKIYKDVPKIDTVKFLKISVKDGGFGIPHDKIDLIFEPFYTTKESNKGTGMGLPIAYRIVKNHGGFMEVKSEVDVGSEFIIFLPLEKQKMEKIKNAQKTEYGENIKNKETLEKVEDVENTENVWKKKTETGSQKLIEGSGKILIADDEPTVLKVIASMLKRMGFEVITAVNGKEALKKYKLHHHEINLVILDLFMAEMDGKECFQEIKKINSDIKLIISTGYGSNKKRLELQEMGITGIIQKPYTITELSTVLKYALEM
ncbi:MAG: ATP-binding response regulator [Promethearchaeota archaeon]